MAGCWATPLPVTFLDLSISMEPASIELPLESTLLCAIQHCLLHSREQYCNRGLFTEVVSVVAETQQRQGIDLSTVTMQQLPPHTEFPQLYTKISLSFFSGAFNPHLATEDHEAEEVTAIMMMMMRFPLIGTTTSDDKVNLVINKIFPLTKFLNLILKSVKYSWVTLCYSLINPN